MSETLSDGRIINGGTTNVKGQIKITNSEIKELKNEIYSDFLLAKQSGKIPLDYIFDSWLADSIRMLQGVRKYDILTELNLGKISKSEFDALEEMREKMITAIITMDTRDLDKYGITYLDPTFANISQAKNQLLTPTYRPHMTKFKSDKIKEIITK